MYIDDKGGMHYGIPLIDLAISGPELAQTYNRMASGIMDSYFKLYLNVKPGSTLGIVHSSMVSVHVEGKMAPAK
jgi:hypothetical protein